MPAAYRIAVLGFSEFERRTLASYFRLATNRDPRYVQEPLITDADFIVADADHGPSVQLVAAIERMGETVFVGHRAPTDARAWMARPIDPLHVMRELDAMVAVTHPVVPTLATDAPGTITQAVQRAQATGATSGPHADAAAEPPTTATDAAPDTDDSALLQRRDPTPQPEPAPRPESPPPSVPVPAAADAKPAAHPRPRKPAAPSPAPAIVMPPPSALLVDDSEVALRFLETRLQRWGMQIDRASSSRKAIELLAQRDYGYDFVFVDLELGEDSELDGLSLCQHIKRHQGEGAALGSSVFIVSAHQTELDRVRGALAGCDAYLGKPLQDIDLRRLLIRHGLKPPEAPPSDDIEAI